MSEEHHTVLHSGQSKPLNKLCSFIFGNVRRKQSFSNRTLHILYLRHCFSVRRARRRKYTKSPDNRSKLAQLNCCGPSSSRAEAGFPVVCHADECRAAADCNRHRSSNFEHLLPPTVEFSLNKWTTISQMIRGSPTALVLIGSEEFKGLSMLPVYRRMFNTFVKYICKVLRSRRNWYWYISF